MALNARAVKMVRLPAMHFIGPKIRLNLNKAYDDDVERLWADKFTNSIAALSLFSVYGNRYGVIKPVDEQGNADYFAAVQTPKAAVVPADAQAIDVPARSYAWLKIRRPAEVSRAIDQIIGQFLKYDAPEYWRNPKYPCITVYNRQTEDMRVHGVDVYVPAELAVLATS